LRARAARAWCAAEVRGRRGCRRRRRRAGRPPHLGLRELPVHGEIEVQGREPVAEVLASLLLIETETQLHGSAQLVQVLVGQTALDHTLHARSRLGAVDGIDVAACPCRHIHSGPCCSSAVVSAAAASPTSPLGSSPSWTAA
jgi:hypothetical protein